MPIKITTSHDVTPHVIHLVSKSQLDAWKASADEASVLFLEACDGKQSIYTLPGSHPGHLVVLCIVDDDPSVIASLPTTLACHSYTLDSEFLTSVDEEAILLQWQLGEYRYLRYKSKEQPPLPTLVIPQSYDAAYQQALMTYEAIALARDLINCPSEDLGPAELSDTMQRLADRYQGEFTTIVGEDLLKHQLNAIHAVGRASTRAPRLLSLQWGNPQHRTLTLVGKGVCFDSGGLNIKHTPGMKNMKKDMGGAAHVIALAQLIMAAKLPINLQLLVPAVDNLIAGNAYKPGDVIRTLSGITAVIENTDAEGRLILADTLTWAQKKPSELIIDFATLTGAARIALGLELPALFCNDSTIREELVALSTEVNDDIWPMPLYQGYQKYIKSDIADVANAGATGYGGAITAALFLEKFVSGPWCHFDISALNDRAAPGKPVGAATMGIMTVFSWLKKRYTQDK